MASTASCCSNSGKPGASGGLALLSGLLCSSCCLIQLVFNALSLGCAGFAHLDPYKPYFLSLTAALLMHMLLTRGLNKSTAGIAVASVLIAASQHILKAHNQGRLFTADSSSTPVQGMAVVEPSPSLYQVTFQVQQLKCEGCAAYLRQQLSKQPGVHQVTVDFTSKQVAIKYDGQVQSPGSIASAIQAVDDSYQPAEVLLPPHAQLLGEPTTH